MLAGSSSLVSLSPLRERRDTPLAFLIAIEHLNGSRGGTRGQATSASETRAEAEHSQTFEPNAQEGDRVYKEAYRAKGGGETPEAPLKPRGLEKYCGQEENRRACGSFPEDAHDVVAETIGAGVRRDHGARRCSRCGRGGDETIALDVD